MTDLPGANVRTPARRRRIVQTGNAARMSKSALRAETVNPILDSEIRAEASAAGALAATQTHLQSAGACLSDRLAFNDEPNALEGVAAGLANLFEAFQKMAGDPSNFGRRLAVVRCAQKVAGQFRHAASRLSGLENDLNASILEDVARANHELDDIACLNRLVIEAQSEGGSPELLLSQRAGCLESLASFASIATDTNDDASLNLTIAGVAMVCGPETADSLAAYPGRNGNYYVRARKSGIPLPLESGSIAGKIDVRDTGLADLQKGMNVLAGQLILHVNTIYKTGLDLNGGTGQDFFTGSCAAEIGVNIAVVNDPAKLQMGAAPEGDGNHGVAADLGQLGRRSLSELGHRTFAESLARTLGGLDEALSGVNDNLMSRQALRQMLANERGLAPGGSFEDKKNDLLRYQQAYTGSSQLMEALTALPPVK